MRWRQSRSLRNEWLIVDRLIQSSAYLGAVSMGRSASLFFPFSVPPQPMVARPSSTASEQILTMRNTVDLRGASSNETSRPGYPGRLDQSQILYLTTVEAVLVVLPALLLPQPTATTEKARTAARTSNFFIKGSR